MAVSSTWPSSSGWMWVRSLAVEPNFSAARSCVRGFVRKGLVDQRWKKNAQNLEPIARLAAGRYRWGSDGPPRRLDWQTSASDQPRVRPVGSARLPKHRASLAPPARL